MSECDVDDILCQLRLLDSLKSLRQNLGNEEFRREFPELEGLDSKIANRIETQELTLRDTISRCGNIEEAEVFYEDE